MKRLRSRTRHALTPTREVDDDIVIAAGSSLRARVATLPLARLARVVRPAATCLYRACAPQPAVEARSLRRSGGRVGPHPLVPARLAVVGRGRLLYADEHRRRPT